MATRRDIERKALGELKELLLARPPVDELFRQSGRVLGTALGYDAVCWHLNDPITGFVTTVQSDDLDLRGFAMAVQLETMEDLASFTRIRASGKAAETLSRMTDGRPDRSVRYRELLSPAGFGDELRANFDASGGRWGCAAFMRSAGRGHYRPEELRLVQVAAKHIGAALRDLHTPETKPGVLVSDLPALVVLGPNDRLVSANPAAQAVIADLPIDTTTGRDVPTAFVMIAHEARDGRTAKVRVRTADGTWLVAHASPLDSNDGSVAIVVTAATPTELVPVTLLSYGLTAREQDVALHTVRGLNTNEVARMLSIAPFTVQDHLKAIFDKTGTRTRQELIARLVIAALPDLS